MGQLTTWPLFVGLLATVIGQSFVHDYIDNRFPILLERPRTWTSIHVAIIAVVSIAAGVGAEFVRHS